MTSHRLQAESLQTIDLDENEAAFSVAVVPFAERGGEIMLVVGTAVEVTIAPRTCSKGFLRVYKISDDMKAISVEKSVEKGTYDEFIKALPSD